MKAYSIVSGFKGFVNFRLLKLKRRSELPPPVHALSKAKDLLYFEFGRFLCAIEESNYEDFSMLDRSCPDCHSKNFRFHQTYKTKQPEFGLGYIIIGKPLSLNQAI